MATYGRREGSDRMTRAAASGAAAVSQASQGLREQYNRSAAMGAEAPVTAFKAASQWEAQKSDKAAADARISMAERDTKLAEKGAELRERELGAREKEIERRAAADERRAELDELNTLLKAQEAGATISDGPGGMPPAAPGGAAPQDPQGRQPEGPPMPQQEAGSVAQGTQTPAGQEPGSAPTTVGAQDPLAQADNLLQRILAGDQERQQEQMGKPLEVTIGGRTVSIPPPRPKGIDLVSRANAATGLLNAMTSFRKARDAASAAEASGDQERLEAEQEAMRNAIGKTRDVLNGISGKIADPKAIADLGAVAGKVQDPELQAFLQTNGAVGKGAATRFLRNQLMKQNLEYVATGGNFIDADYSHPLTADFLNLYRETAQSFEAIGGLNQQFVQENPVIADLHGAFGTFEQWAALDDFTEKNKFLRKQTAMVMLARMTLMSKEAMSGALGGGGGDGRPTITAGSAAGATQQVMNERRAQDERTRMAGPGPNAGPGAGLREPISGPGTRQDWGKIR